MLKVYNSSISILFLTVSLLLSACSDDMVKDEPIPSEESASMGAPEVPEKVFDDDVYSLNFMVTLDNLGSRAVTGSVTDPEEIVRNENYINLERFRILFFDENDKFLFESKNRWVKQVDANDEYSSWFVSVPFGAFGNDSYGEGKEYDWNAIRTHMTTRKFKIAILANRPAQLLYPGNFADSELQLPNGVFDNDGPYWGPGDTGKRDVFDLHHYQYDIIYADKGNHSGGASASYYDFIMDDINTDRPTMGSAINWVSFDDNEKEVLTSSVNMRHCIMPGKEHPIPMYGIQEFEPIPADLWKEGTPFDLSNSPQDIFPNIKYGDKEYDYKSVSLLRSCVRLDLIIPKSIKNGAKPTFLSLWYSNIYSRTEPMDTWTPTDQIWKEDHDVDCEWKGIMNYGPISSNIYSNGNGTTKDAYQKRMSWFYGAWKDKGWKFKTRSGSTVTPVAATSTTPYPRIFNTCIQRNKVVWFGNCDVSSYYADGDTHYVIYTGERNMNDPNTLPTMNKNPYIACLVISWDKSKYYCIPLLHYGKVNDSDFPGIGPFTYNPYSTGAWPSEMNTYMNSLMDEKENNLPYPLLRNHIYRFTLSGRASRGGNDEDDDLGGLSVSSEVLQTSDINFSNETRTLNIKRIPSFPKE